MFRLALAALFLVATAFGWLAYSQGKSRVIGELVAASQGNDIAAFAARVDWDGMRAFLKKDLAAQKSTPLGANMGPDAGRIDAVVDYFVRPENIDILFYHHDEVFKGVPERDFIAAEGFAPPFGFYVTLALPEAAAQKGSAMAAFRDRFRVKAVFRPDGLTWKATELHVPLHMVPRHAYDTPALKVYGRTQR